MIRLTAGAIALMFAFSGTAAHAQSHILDRTVHPRNPAPPARAMMTVSLAKASPGVSHVRTRLFQSG